MEFVFDARSANSSFVEMIWHTHSERAGTFTSVAVSNWEMAIAYGTSEADRDLQRQDDDHRTRFRDQSIASRFGVKLGFVSPGAK
jgi:hypothetical protein